MELRISPNSRVCLRIFSFGLNLPLLSTMAEVQALIGRIENSRHLSSLAGGEECKHLLAMRLAATSTELVWHKRSSQTEKLLARSSKNILSSDTGGLSTIWLSLDADNEVVKLGMGSRTSHNTLLQFDIAKEGM